VTFTEVSVFSPLLKGKRVVICEDEGLIVMQLNLALTHAGLVVVGMAGNGQEAVETVLRERPDLVTMDVRMPLLDGIEATRQILSVYPVCILVVSAFANAGYQDKARQAGASGYLVKPILGETLLPALQSAWQAFEHPGR